jgi:hypothetical protein
MWTGSTPVRGSKSNIMIKAKDILILAYSCSINDAYIKNPVEMFGAYCKAKDFKYNGTIYLN